jgi:hypothetical protein
MKMITRFLPIALLFVSCATSSPVDLRTARPADEPSASRSTALSPLVSRPVPGIQPVQKQAGAPSLWSRTYGGKNSDWGQQILQTSEGNFIVTGWTASARGRAAGGFVLKLDPQGKLVWQKTYRGQRHDNLSVVREATDGDYVLAGSTSSYSATQGAWVLKLNAAGNVLWQKAYRGSRIFGAYAGDRTTDGGSVLGGFTKTSDKPDDAWIIKLDQDGAIEWQKSYGGPKTDIFTSVRETDDRGFIAAGLSSSFGGPEGTVWIVKLKSDGSVAWQKTFDRQQQGQVSSIQQTTDGGYVAAGWYWHVENPVIRAEIFVWKLGRDGSLAWQKTYANNDGADARSISQTADGGFIVGGAVYGLGKPNNASDLLLLKLDSQGEIVWQQGYGGDRLDIAGDVRETEDHALVALGSTYSFGSGKVDVWVLKVDKEGRVAFNRSSKAKAVPLHLVSSPCPAEARDTDATVAETHAKVVDTWAKIIPAGFKVSVQADTSALKAKN